MEGRLEEILDFEWYNEDLLGKEEELLEISRFLMNRLMDPSCEGRPVMLVEIDENFGFENIFFKNC